MTGRLIYLWSPPRARSTAFLRMMTERGDFLVIHEPFSSITVRGYALIGTHRISTEDDLIDFLLEQSADRNVFVKETTEYRYRAIDDDRLTGSGTHTFIIRDPGEVIASHCAMNPDLTQEEVGFEHQYEIFLRTGAGGVVIEAERLVADPAASVAEYCTRVGIPFVESALSWTPEDRAEWSRTGQWHRDVAVSSGFTAPQHEYSRTVHNDPVLADYHRYQFPFYDQLRIAARTVVPSRRGRTTTMS